ncbi:MAG: hypothetical protein CM15mP130_0390 [Verrucomicrobiota bacterium]|nr:MAG: hypothetical protein CM15mP130_0390 [Verrucomicrobiota bacterium]
MNLSGFTKKRVVIGGFSIVGSPKVSDFALKEAAYLIDKMTMKHPEYLKKLAENKVRFSIMAGMNLPRIFPEHSDMTPLYFGTSGPWVWEQLLHARLSVVEKKIYWPLKAPPQTGKYKFMSLPMPCMPWQSMTLIQLFNQDLKNAFKGIEEKIWEGTYAASNPAEYFAEGVQSWYECNRANDPVNTDPSIQEKKSKSMTLVLPI